MVDRGIQLHNTTKTLNKLDDIENFTKSTQTMSKGLDGKGLVCTTNNTQHEMYQKQIMI